MRRVLMRLVVAVIVLSALSPAMATAQTPVAATPEPSFEITITELGVSALDDELVHALLSISIEPGAPVPPLNGMQSVIIAPQQGSLLVSASGEAVRVDVGTGEPVQSGDGAQVVCERGDCVLDSGQAVILGPGNGLSVTQGSVEMETHGDAVAVVQVSTLLPRAQLDERCWICPTA